MKYIKPVAKFTYNLTLGFVAGFTISYAVNKVLYKLSWD